MIKNILSAIALSAFLASPVIFADEPTPANAGTATPPAATAPAPDATAPATAPAPEANAAPAKPAKSKHARRHGKKKKAQEGSAPAN